LPGHAVVGHALPDGQSDFPQLPLPQHPAATNMTAPANAAIIRAFLNIFISPFLLVTGTPDPDYSYYTRFRENVKPALEKAARAVTLINQ
jgi:hypothetical protein